MDRSKSISRVTLWGAAGNLLLSAFKMLSGILGHSASMVADAVHSLTDLVSDAIVLVMVRFSGKRADKDHQWGHGKYETLATVVIACMLLVVSGELMAKGVENIDKVLKGGEIPVPGVIALWAAIVSILVKEALFQWTYIMGKKLNSPAMITNAWHHRSDALSSVGAALGIGAAKLLGGKWVILDPVVCCIISIVIIVIAVKMAIPAIHELTEGSLPEDIQNNIIGIMESVDGVDGIHNVKARRNGPRIVLSAHIVVDPNLPVRDADKVCKAAQAAVKAVYGPETILTLQIEPDSTDQE